MNLKSSINDVGDKVVQIIHFDNGEEKTWEILPKTLRVGSFTKVKTTDGKLLAINQKRVLWFESHEICSKQS